MASELTLFWSRRAQSKHRKFREYIARNDIEAAKKWARQTRDLTRNLIKQPKLGRKVPEFDRDDLRELIYAHHYRIVYRLSYKEIEIVTIFHTAQELPTKL